MPASLRFESRRRAVRAALAGLILAAPLSGVASSPAAAQLRDVVIQFLPPTGAPVTGYALYASDVATGGQEIFDAGYVEPDADGVARTSVALDAARSYLVAMTAYNDAGESPPSNEILVEAEAPVCEPALCDDANPCTADSCDAAGCFSTPLADGTACDDGYVDTVDDQCVQGSCEGVLLACRDDLECDDGNVCNGLEVCDGGRVCLEGTPLDCGEPTDCYQARCDAVWGCMPELQPDGTPCDDGLAETHDDACRSGVCYGIPEPGGPPGPLALHGLDPAVVAPGQRQVVSVYGQGFVPGVTLSFLNEKGRPPRVVALELVDEGVLVATLDVSRKLGKRPRRWDALVTRPDGAEALLPDALQIQR